MAENLRKCNLGSENWGRTLEKRDLALGDILGSDVGLSGGNQHATGDFHNLLLSRFGSRSIHFFPFGLKRQRNSPFRWMIFYNDNDLSIQAVTNDEDLFEAYKESHQK